MIHRRTETLILDPHDILELLLAHEVQATSIADVTCTLTNGERKSLAELDLENVCLVLTVHSDVEVSHEQPHIVPMHAV